MRVYSESVQRASGKAKERKELICNVDVCIFKKDAPFENPAKIKSKDICHKFQPLLDYVETRNQFSTQSERERKSASRHDRKWERKLFDVARLVR